MSLVRALVLAVLVGIPVVTVLILAYEALFVLKVVALGLLLALALRTLVRGLEKLGASPFISVVVLLAGFGVSGGFVYFVMIPNIAGEVRLLISQGPGSLSALAGVLNDLPFGPDSSQLIQRLESYLPDLLGSLPSLAIFAVQEIIAIISGIFLSLYLAMSPDAYVKGLLRLVPVNRREGAEEFVYDLAGRLRGRVVFWTLSPTWGLSLAGLCRRWWL